jgi:uncharacterized membrane protein YkvA (DUF1232 family)
MAQIVEFVHRGMAKITPETLETVYKKIPLLKLEIAELHEPNYPHLAEQLGILADLVEDFAEGVVEDVPYMTIAGAVFALLYSHRQIDLIPDSIPGFGKADDSAVVRVVMIENEKVLADYAEKQGKQWLEIGVEP